MKAASKRICSARNRQGDPCQKPPLKGKQRCKLHGGATPKGRQTGPLKHGLYSVALSDEERDLWDDIQIGNVDDELRLCRIQLRRAINLDAAIGKAPNDPKNLVGIELVETRRTTGNGKSSTDATSKRPDIAGRMNALLGRIAQLEKTRSELIAAAQAAGEGAGDVARDLVDTLRAMKRTEFEQPKPKLAPDPAPEPDADV
jgi:hypothetical protein